MKKLMKPGTIFILLSLLMTSFAFAQGNDLIIKGTVRTGSGDAIDFAIVQLYNSNGEVMLATTTDSIGRYFFAADKSLPYILSVSALGYITTDSVTTGIIHDTVYTVPDIILQQDVHHLSTVNITGRKDLYEMKTDKLVMNVEGNAIAAGNSVFEVIRKAPTVSLDREDNLKLKGAPAQIYIDGKQAFLTGQQLTDYLKSLPADMVATIEIITQPSGKYEAAGISGIINIKLKKNKAYGLNGTASIGGGIGRYPKLNGGLNLNYRKGKTNIYGNLNPVYSEGYNQLNYNSIIESPANTIYQDRDNYWHPKTTWLPFTIGADFNINDRSIIGIQLDRRVTKSNAVTTNNSVFKNRDLEPYQYINSIRTDNSKAAASTYNINYKTRFDSAGSELAINADYVRYHREGVDINENVFLDRQQESIRNPYLFRNTQPGDISLLSSKIDYTKYLSGKSKIEAGAKYSYVQSDNNLIVDSVGNNEEWINDKSRSNHFRYNEQIIAAYINWNTSWKNTSLQLGLRGEQTNGSGNSITLNQINKVNYFSLFPTVYLSQVIDSSNTLSISYGRRINRPDYESLNPFIYYIDPYTAFEGNPNLKPFFSHALEVKHSYRQTLFTTLSYRYSKGDAISAIFQDEHSGRVVNIAQNAGKSHYLRLDLFGQWELKKWWTIQASAGIAYSHATSEVPQYSYNTRAFSADFNTQHTFILGQDWNVQTSFYYDAPTRDGLAKLRSAYSWSLGVQKQLWNQRLTIKANATNILATNAFRAHYMGEGLDIRWRNEWEGRKFNISFTYRFGSSKIKATRERSTSSEEKTRIGL
jgi:hypothetical protein